jgi:arylsulfatase A-like enzyme
VVFFSDNGGNMHSQVEGVAPTSNRPLRGGKATLFEGGTRVPCAVIWPGKVKPGSTSDALLSSTDFYPTLLEMLGLKAQPGQRFDGVSQVPALLGQGAPPRRPSAFSLHPGHHQHPRRLGAARRLKLIRFFSMGSTRPTASSCNLREARRNQRPYAGNPRTETTRAYHCLSATPVP